MLLSERLCALGLFLKLSGGISFFKFSLIMSFIVLINNFAIVFSLWISIKNKVIALIGITAVIFYQNLNIILYKLFIFTES